MLNVHLENESIINDSILLFKKSAPSRFHREVVPVKNPHAFCEGLYKGRDDFSSVVLTGKD